LYNDAALDRRHHSRALGRAPVIAAANISSINPGASPAGATASKLKHPQSKPQDLPDLNHRYFPAIYTANAAAEQREVRILIGVVL
jgi:hypothetical protein